MNAIQRAFLKSIGQKIEAGVTAWKGIEASVVGGCIKAAKADERRKAADKGWDTKLSFKTYQKLHAQDVV